MLKHFRKDTDGNAAIEGLFGGALLLTWLMVAYQFYDAFRVRAIVGTSSYTVADLISRQTDTIGPTFVNGSKKIFDQITRARTGANSWIRVSLISCQVTETDTANCNGTAKSFRLDASYATGAHPALTQADLNQRSNKIPTISAGDSAVILETFYTYWPIFDIGDRSLTVDGQNATVNGFNANMKFSEFIVTRPRGPRIVWNAGS